MSINLQAILSLGLVVILIALLHGPFGDYMYRVFTQERHWRIEAVFYRLAGIDPRTGQRWPVYAISVLAFAVASVLFLWALLMVEPYLPWGGGAGMSWHAALNTAVSFVTNTNWQSYTPENCTGPVSQMAGLAVQNFVSAGTGIAVAIALVRGIAGNMVPNSADAGADTIAALSNTATNTATNTAARTPETQPTDRLGNFWVDLTRAVTRILLPIATIAAVVFTLGGVVQNFAATQTVTTVDGHALSIPGGPVASQEVIKLLGTNGGGFFAANSAHPFENPSALINVLQILLVLMIAFSLPRTFGRMVGDVRQGRVIFGVMALLFTVQASLVMAAEIGAAQGADGGMEGKEQRFGLVWSALFGTATTATSTGAVNSLHDSYSPLGGGALLLNMMLGEVSPGGVGTGLYNMLVLVVLAVFIAGLMVGRTPEYLGKSIGRREITFSALNILVMPALVLLGTGVSLLIPAARQAITATGPHGLSQLLYGFTSTANNNGSAFAGLVADQPYLNVIFAAVMFLARFVSIGLVLALAGSFAAQQRRPVSSGTMPTHTPLFAGLVIGVILIVAGLTFFPALSLGPIAEAVL